MSITFTEGIFVRNIVLYDFENIQTWKIYRGVDTQIIWKKLRVRFTERVENKYFSFLEGYFLFLFTVTYFLYVSITRLERTVKMEFRALCSKM